MGCPGLHCGGCSDGGGAFIGLAVVAGAAYAVYRVATSKPVEHAAVIAWHVAEITGAVVGGLAVVSVAAIAATALRNRLIKGRAPRAHLVTRQSGQRPRRETPALGRAQTYTEPDSRVYEQVRAARQWN